MSDAARERSLQELALARYLELYYTQGNLRRWVVSCDKVTRILPSNLKIGGMVLHEFNFSAILRIASDINHFLLLINQLQLWEKVLGTFTRDEQHLISLFWVEPYLNFALLTPYNLKQRIIYSGTKSLLLVYANDRRSKIIPLPTDEEISMKTLRKWHDKMNPCHRRLIEAIRRIDAPSLSQPRAYRRKHVHHLPPYLLIGLQTQVTIGIDQNGYTQAVALQSPVSIDRSIEWCLAEHRLSRIAFAALLRLFKEQMRPYRNSPSHE
ncbi:MAG TPA: hypothetical protein VIM48_09840 [Chthoniobacterales bacterium]